MHPNPAFRRGDDDALLTEFAAIAFARVFAATPAGPRVAHAPMWRSGPRALRFHLANTNALTAHLDGASALALAEGPRAYISANWYADPRGAVPTWNYVAIEAQGPARQLDRAALVELLDRLSAEREPRVGEDWTRAKMAASRFEAMLGAITAFELDVREVRGTHKLSQNQPDAVAARLADAVARTGDPALAAAMRAARA